MLPLIIGGVAVVGGLGYLIFGGKSSSTPAAIPSGTDTPARQEILNTALTTVDDPNQLNALAAAFQQQGLPAQAAQLQQKAASLPNAATPAEQAATQAQTDAAIAAMAQQQAMQTAADTAAAAAIAASSNASAALLAQLADQNAQAALPPIPTPSLADQAASIFDPSAMLGTITGPKVTLQEQINQATESGGGILRAIVGNMPSIQMTLNAVMGTNLDVDGQKGPMTLAAIKQFQGSQGLTQDGDPGPQTVAALNARLTA